MIQPKVLATLILDAPGCPALLWEQAVPSYAAPVAVHRRHCLGTWVQVFR